MSKISHQWRIINKVIDLLKTVTIANGYEVTIADAFIPKKILKFTENSVAIYFNSPEKNDEYGMGNLQKFLSLNLGLVFCDLKSDEDTGIESYLSRNQNIGSDLQLLFNNNLSLGGEAYNNEIVSSLPLLFEDNDTLYETFFVEVKISFKGSLSDPYL
jgi:hypothetical protein